MECFIIKKLYRKAVAGLSMTVAGVGMIHAQNKAPNILFIMSDDHTTQAISAYGGFLGNILPTPNIDRLGMKNK